MDHESQHSTLELVRDTRWPSLKFGLGLTLALFILSMMLTIFSIVRNGDPWVSDPVESLIQMISNGMIWLRVVAIVGGFVAALWLGPRLKRSDNYELLGANQRVRALLIGALHRILIVLALLIGLMPLPVAARYQANARVAGTGCFVFTTAEEKRAAFDEWLGYPSPGGGDCASLSDSRLLQDALLAVIPAVAWLGVILLSTALGAGVALSRHRISSLIIGLCGIAITLIAVLTVLGPPPIGHAVVCGATCTLWAIWPPRLAPPLVAAVSPFIIAGGMIAWITFALSSRTHAQTGDPE